VLKQPLAHSNPQLVVKLPRSCGQFALKYFSELIDLPLQ